MEDNFLRLFSFWEQHLKSGELVGNPWQPLLSETWTGPFRSEGVLHRPLQGSVLLSGVMGRPLKFCSMKLSPVKQAPPPPLPLGADDGGHLVLITAQQENTIGLFSPALDPVRSDLA